MDLPVDLLVRKHSKIALSVVILVSLTCTQIPLFNYLGFEFSALVALLAGFLSGWWLLSSRPRRATASLATHSNETATLPPLNAWKLWGEASVFSIVLLAVPFLIMSLNALFVKNCSLGGGALLFLLIPVPAVLFSTSVALLVTAFVQRWQRTLFFLLYLLLLLHIVFVTFTDVQIFAFNPILGFFPGITYDESLDIIYRLILYRGATLAATLALVLVAVGLLRSSTGKKKTLKEYLPLRRMEWILLVATVSFVVITFLFSNRLGLSSSESFVQASLGGIHETEHFIIVYPRHNVDDKRLRELAELHEYLYTEVVTALRVVSVKKITSFLYDSPDQKGRLVGAGRTNIAKPWLWQLHLNLADLNTTLRHELVHVMAAEFGFPLLRVGLNSGLIEGLAAAVERVQYDEPIHRAAALVYSVGVDLDMQSLFSLSGFFKAHPGVSYTLAGSFCRFLIDRYGMRRFKFLYRTGDFRNFYNRDLSSLLSEWRRFLSRYRFNDGAKEKGEYLFRRPSIYMKECARVIASVNRETRNLSQQKNYGAALQSADQSLKLTTNIEAILQRATLLLRMKRYDEVIDMSREKLADTLLAHALLPLRLVFGDALWGRGDVQAAREAYEQILATHLSLGWDETCQLRIEALKDSTLAEVLRPYFLTDADDSVRLDQIRTFSNLHPNSPMLTYLLARELAAKEKTEEALSLLSEIGRMPADVLEYLRNRRMGQLYFRVAEFEKAKMYFWQSLNYVEREERTLEMEEWLRRCDWMSARSKRG